MAVSTYIITTADFKDRAILSQNILTERMTAQIGITQEKYGIKILCIEFYDEVLAHVNGTTVNTDIATLLPFIKDYLVFKAYARYLVSANALATPAGMRVSIDATSDPLSDASMGAITAQAENDAGYYQDQLVNYLELNEDTYTTWRDSICNCSNRRVEANNQFSIVGGDNRKTPIDWT